MQTNEVQFPVSALHAQLGFLQGRILTVIDASFSDKEQRKAVKDLIKSEFQARAYHIDRVTFPDRMAQAGARS